MFLCVMAANSERRIFFFNNCKSGITETHTTLLLCGHRVTCVKWSGEGLIYSASQDTTIKVWRAQDGVMCRNLAVSLSGVGLNCE